MACFIVPMAEAVVTTAVTHILKKKEAASEASVNSSMASSMDSSVEAVKEVRFSRKLKWLSNLLWGGSALLAFEHLWHGEIVPFYPFLTAASSPADAMEMLHEMATVGSTMAIVVTAVWVGMVVVSSVLERNSAKEVKQKEGV